MRAPRKRRSPLAGSVVAGCSDALLRAQATQKKVVVVAGCAQPDRNLDLAHPAGFLLSDTDRLLLVQALADLPELLDQRVEV